QGHLVGPDGLFVRCRLRSDFLEIPQQPLDIFELKLRAEVLAETPAQLLENAPRALHVDLARHLDRGVVAVVAPAQGPAERIGLLLRARRPEPAGPVVRPGPLHALLLHRLGEVLRAPAQSFERAALRVDRAVRAGGRAAGPGPAGTCDRAIAAACGSCRRARRAPTSCRRRRRLPSAARDGPSAGSPASVGGPAASGARHPWRRSAPSVRAYRSCCADPADGAGAHWDRAGGQAAADSCAFAPPALAGTCRARRAAGR